MRLFIQKLLFVIVIITVFNCKSKEDQKNDAFTFIERNAYTINSYNGKDYYRLKGSKDFMDGYYVVGNELRKWEEFEFKKGLLNGDYIIFHDNGEIFSHARYVNGVRHGEELNYSKAGVLTKKKNYNNDKLSGSEYTYHENGKVASETKHIADELVESETYDILGNITSQTFIKDGRTITQKIVEGKIYSEMVSSNYDDYETMKFFNEDGSTKAYLRRIEENNTMYILELDNQGKEIKRVDVKANPKEALKYFSLFN